MIIRVNAANNIAPTADAGSDQAIILPKNSVTLSGKGADPDGTIAGYSWKKIFGTASGSILHTNSATTEVQGLTEGSYQFELTVTDDGVGFDVSRARKLGGLGLMSLDERVRLINGNIAIESGPEQGTKVRVRVPLEVT